MKIHNPRPPQLTEKEMETVRSTTTQVLDLLVANSWYQEGMNKYPYFLAPILENNILMGIGFEIFNDFRTYGQSDDKKIVIFVEADVVGRCIGSTIAGKFQWVREPTDKPFDGRLVLEFSNWELFSFQQLARHKKKFLADFSVDDLKEYLAKIEYRENRPCNFSFIDELDDEDLENYFILPARENAEDEPPAKVRRRLWEKLFIIIYHELVHAKQFDNKNKGYISPEEGKDKYVSQFVEIQPRLGQIIQELIFKRRPKFYQRKMSLGEYLLKHSHTFQIDSKYMSDDALHYILQGTYQWLKENNLVLL